MASYKCNSSNAVPTFRRCRARAPLPSWEEPVTETDLAKKNGHPSEIYGYNFQYLARLWRRAFEGERPLGVPVECSP
jgi:hypothetical protein